MANLSVQQTALTGLKPTYVAAASLGDEFVNSRGRALCHIKNGSGAPITITLDSQVECNYGIDHDLDIIIPAGEERLIGPFDPARFNDVNGRVQVGYSGVTTLTIAIIEVP